MAYLPVRLNIPQTPGLSVVSTPPHSTWFLCLHLTWPPLHIQCNTHPFKFNMASTPVLTWLLLSHVKHGLLDIEHHHHPHLQGQRTSDHKQQGLHRFVFNPDTVPLSALHLALPHLCFPFAAPHGLPGSSTCPRSHTSP